MTTRLLHLGMAAALALALAACGTTRTDRAVSGAGIGAMTGAPGRGAAIGAAVGGAAGALIDPCTLNLGDPYWRDKRASREDYYRRCGKYPPR